jgi:hypothetical protein
MVHRTITFASSEPLLMEKKDPPEGRVRKKLSKGEIKRATDRYES